MSDGTLWKIVGSSVAPRALNTNIFGNVRAIPGPQSMTATPDGSFVMILAATANAYLYEAGVDDFISTRTVITAPITATTDRSPRDRAGSTTSPTARC
jgi:hypothetical protein